MRPDLLRVAPFYHNYIAQVTEDDLAEAFAAQFTTYNEFLKTIPEEKRDYRYAPGKWTIKEVLQHIIDTERIFAYRALRFARMDRTPLPGFDENLFAENARGDSRNWNNLVEEFNAVRRSNEYMFASFDEDQLEAEGISYNSLNYVRAIGFIIVGHAAHHQRVIKERYL